MKNKLRKKLFYLQAYCLVLTLLVGSLLVMGFSNSRKQKFDEIDVGRINVVEKDGRRRMIITNRERSPDLIHNGKETNARKGYRAPGMFFYNEKGDEVGGLIFNGWIENGKPNAGSGLFLDQFNQDQIIGLSYNEEGGARSAGLTVWDRSEKITSDETIKRQQAINLMPEGAEKTEAQKKLNDENASAIRVYVGKRRKAQDAGVFLFDSKGKPRIRMMVGTDDKPKFEFLDENGKVTYSLPESTAK